jgi:hypothetical protein
MTEFYKFASDNPILVFLLVVVVVAGIVGVFDAIARMVRRK